MASSNCSARGELPWRLAERVAAASRGFREVLGGMQGKALSRADALALGLFLEERPRRAVAELLAMRGCFAELSCGGVPLVIYLLRAADRARALEAVAPLMATARPYPAELVWLLGRNLRRWRASTRKEVLQCAAMQPNRAAGFSLLLGLVARDRAELARIASPARAPRTVREMWRAASAALRDPDLSTAQRRELAALLAEHGFLQPLVVFREPRLQRCSGWRVVAWSVLDDVIALYSPLRRPDALLALLRRFPRELLPELQPELAAALQQVGPLDQYDPLETFAGACAAFCRFDPSFLRYLQDNFGNREQMVHEAPSAEALCSLYG